MPAEIFMIESTDPNFRPKIKSQSFEIIENDNNGNCLFDSVFQFLVKGKHFFKDVPKTSNALRLKIVNYILSSNQPGFQSNWDRLKNTLVFNNHKQIPSLLNMNDSQYSNDRAKIDYFNFMSDPGKCGTFTELSAASELFGFKGSVIQIVDDKQFNCYDFGSSPISELNERKPIMFVIFFGDPSSGHFRLLNPKTRKAFVIPSGLYTRTTSDDDNVTLISNVQRNEDMETKKDNHTAERKFICELCPIEDQKPFATKKGLRIHTTRKHPGHVIRDTPENVRTDDGLKFIGSYKRKIRLLNRIPKGARILAASKLTSIMNDCVSDNDSASWENLILFSYKALHAPEKSKSKSLVSAVKANITNFTLPHVKNLPNRKKKVMSTEEKLIERVEAKVADFDIRGAVRLLTSNDSLAISDANTLRELQKKHPTPSRPLNLPEKPTKETESYVVNEQHVKKAINSFKHGSASGIDGLSPQFMKDIISHSAGAAGTQALTAITRLCNFMLSGQINKDICKYIYGAALCALQKKCGGIRPIAIGNYFRRLASKLACAKIRDEIGGYFRPHQIGFATKLGCEAAIHATRSTVLSSKNTNKILLKIDYKNAFNSVERDVMLSEIKENTPKIYAYLWQCYSEPSFLFYGDEMILSEVGAQQGDPAGPLAFSLSIQPIINSLQSELNVWYLDDGTLCDHPEKVLADFKNLIEKSKQLGLEVNPSKCELYFCSGSRDENVISKFEEIAPNIQVVNSANLNLLGSPVLEEGFDHFSNETFTKLSALLDRLPKLNSHVAYVILKNCFGIPKLTYLLRTNPVWMHQNFIERIDNAIKNSLESILNIHIKDEQWKQASLPIKLGGLGIRKSEDIALPSFLSSTYGSKNLVSQIMNNSSGESLIHYFEDAVNEWNMLNPNQIPQVPEHQRNWDSINSKRIIRNLNHSSPIERSRFLASQTPESGAWLNAIPSANVGTFLNNNELRIGMALRLGSEICKPHKCICGERVDSNGLHSLSCIKSQGRFSRHSEFNDITARALRSTNIPAKLEPTGLYRDDGKRPDGMTLIPWAKGQALVWDATCVDTFANSYLNQTSKRAGSAADQAVRRKHNLYKNIKSQNYHFVALAVETMGSWSTEAKQFFSSLGKKLEKISGDPRSVQFLYQRLSLAIQKNNAVCIMGSIPDDVKMEEIFYL